MEPAALDPLGKSAEPSPCRSAAKLRRQVMRERLNEVAEIVKQSLVTSEEIAFLRNVFNFIDTDGDGFLNEQEIVQILQYMGESQDTLRKPEILSQLMKRLDSDGNGQITFPQFLEWWAKMDFWNKMGVAEESKETESLREAFRAYDQDCSGEIDLVELHQLLRDLGHDYKVGELKRMLRLIADDGVMAQGLNFEQFQSLVLQINYWSKVCFARTPCPSHGAMLPGQASVW